MRRIHHGFTFQSPSVTVNAMLVHRIMLWLILALVATGCATKEPAAQKSGDVPSAPEAYVRIYSAGSNDLQLQIALRKFVPPRRNSPLVWLVGVSHVGESNYYARIQEHLDAQQLVLFEGIGERSHPREERSQHSPNIPVPAAARDARLSSLQSTIADSLGLVFQLEAIDYNRPNFRNSDLSIQELRDIFAGAGQGGQANGASESFESLLSLMEGGSFFDTVLQTGLRLLGASRKFQALSKLALMDAIDEIGGDPGRVAGLPTEFKDLLEGLIEKRNQRVITDLSSDMAEVGGGGSISIFFGTGHMPDMERRLREQLHYRPAGDVWLTAFEVNLSSAGVSASERQFIHDLVRRSLDQFKPEK